MKQAVILAGGEGTRLASRLNGLPKPLIDFCGHPLLWHQLGLLRRHGYTNVIILVGYRGEKISEYLNTNSSWDMEIECISELEPLGTAGAVLSIFHRLADTFLVVYGDTMLDIDLIRFEKFHRSAGYRGVSLLVHPNNHPYDSDLVEVDPHNRVVNFHPYPHEPGSYYKNLVNAALYMIDRESLSSFVKKKLNFRDFGKHIFPQMAEQGLPLRAYNSPEYIKDCGTPERLDGAIRDFNSGKIRYSNLNTPQAAIFIDRDGTINKCAGHISDVKNLSLLEGVCDAIKLINDAGYRCILITNQPVVARGECSLLGLSQIHNKLECLLGVKNSFIDRIYFCPHHPDTGFENEVVSLKVPCGCRKPGIGMLKQAQKDLNIDLQRSWFIGDTTVDMQTAKNAGVKSVLVQTGEAGMDGKYNVDPDYVSPNLLSAVKHVLFMDQKFS